jgi:hypothetical protein
MTRSVAIERELDVRHISLSFIELFDMPIIGR